MALFVFLDFNSNVPSAIDEPTDKEGNISITTDCLFRESDIVVNWYTVQGVSFYVITKESLKSVCHFAICVNVFVCVRMSVHA